jgi:NAD(P)-dependent dehydrogenase (short-subunit alcohol dehydrogenase family)
MESHSGDQFDRLLSLYPTRRSHDVRARHGSIINISAGSGERSSPGGPAYALTKQAAADLAPTVRANGLISGLVGTPIGSKEMGSRKPKYDMIPLRRMGQLMSPKPRCLSRRTKRATSPIRSCRLMGAAKIPWVAARAVERSIKPRVD